MTDREEFSEQFEAWWLTKFSKEFLDSDNCWSAWTGWQARGELDAVRIKELEDRLNDTKNYHIEWCGANVKIADLTAKLEKETGRADAWVKAVRDLARELGTPDEDSNGSIQDWKRITAKAKQVAELTAKLDKAREALKYLDDAFDNEMWNCERCGHAESTKDMDSASYLKNAIREKNG